MAFRRTSKSGAPGGRRQLADLFDREPPHSPDDETNLLGSMILDPRVIPQVIEVITDSAAFYDDERRRIFDAIIKVWKHDATLASATLLQALRDGGVVSIGSEENLTDIASSVPTAVNATHFADVVARRYKQRRHIDSAKAALYEGLTTNIQSDDDVHKMIAQGVARTARLLDAPGQQREIVLLGPDEHRAVNEAEIALARDLEIYSRGGELVRVQRAEHRADGPANQVVTPRISQVPPANLRDRLTRVALIKKFTKRGVLVDAHPPQYLVHGLGTRAQWPGIRPLTSVSDTPVLRPDGSVWQTRGYDARTGVLFDSEAVFPVVPEEISQATAQASAHSLLEVIQDFRFESPWHKSGWMASLLTPIARIAFAGPSPAFAFDANMRGVGKGLLCHVVGKIVQGRRMAIGTYTRDDDEMRKRITSIALAGQNLFLFDNIDCRFGNPSLDAALTGVVWTDRMLNRSELVTLPLVTTWYVTGNNILFTGDADRRVLHVRLEVFADRPEERSNFAQPNLVEWVGTQRERLVGDAITILAGFIRAGRPDQGLPARGSYEGWSDLVRQAIVWAGQPDPWPTGRSSLQTSDDEQILGQLHDAFELFDPDDRGFIAAVVVRELNRSDAAESDRLRTMRAALEAVCSVAVGQPLDARIVGSRLKKLRRRPLNGRILDWDPNEHNREGAVWHLKRLPTNGVCDATQRV